MTAGLNPSEDEFRDKNQIGEDGIKKPLEGKNQRFLHWPKHGQLTAELEDEALRRAQGYFVLGNCYREWFRAYDDFLPALGGSFFNGTACHTDYVSPFATVKGISKCLNGTLRKLRVNGFGYWVRMLELCPRLEVIFGHGRGWRELERFFQKKLHDLPTPFDNKGWHGRHLSWTTITLPRNCRPIPTYWWHPNRDGMPLCWLDGPEKCSLGKIINDHRATLLA